MAVDPQVQAVLDLIEKADNPSYHTLPAAVARAQHEERSAVLDLPAVQVASIADHTVNEHVSVRVYRYDDAEEKAPAIVWIHGGGHVIGSVQSYNSVCTRLCSASRATVVSVEYRLAPEHKFPAAVQDSFKALEWVVENATRLNIDTDRLAVAGDSAGGNLAAVTAILARDAGISLRAQGLVYPVTAPDAESASHHANAEGKILTRDMILWFQSHYRRGESDREDWRYAPLIAPALHGVAPAFVLVAELDPLRDEGIAYAQRLMDSEVEVRLSQYAGTVHGFFQMGGAIGAAVRAQAELAEFLRTHLGMESDT